MKLAYSKCLFQNLFGYQGDGWAVYESDIAIAKTDPKIGSLGEALIL